MKTSKGPKVPEFSPEQEALLERAVELLRNGGTLLYPTETLYGLGCDAANEAALRRLFAIKGRAEAGEAFKPPPVLVSGVTMLETFADVSAPARDLIARFWPGALTLVLPARPGLSSLLTGTQAQTIGVRASAHPIARELVARLGSPLVATSANLSGATGSESLPHRLEDVSPLLRARVDFALDGGEVMGAPSTVLDCTVSPPRILRQGAVIIDL